MATPQRQFPNEPPQQPEEPRLRRVDTPVRRNRSWFWIWIFLFIAAIIWFAGWGFGGYGGWWWGRTPGPTIRQPAPGTPGNGGTTTAPGNGGTATSPGNGSTTSGPARNGATGNGSGGSSTGNSGTAPR